MRKIIVDEDVFDMFPDFVRGVVVVSDIDNAPQNNAIEKLLQQEMERRAGEDLVGADIVKDWDEVHRKFGSNPNRYPPSIKALLKRIQKGGTIPFINSVVALFNYISIKYLVPCGGDDVDTIEGNFRVSFAQGDEKFTPLGSEEEELPEKGEVIYVDDVARNVMCRRWNWRNGSFTKITEKTKKIVINIDGVGAADKTLIEEARDELAGLLTEHCGAKVETFTIDKENPTVSFEL